MKTRKQYMAGEVDHNEYYGQFVTEATIDLVKSRIGLDRLLKSTDRHFNDIPLNEWDSAAKSLLASHPTWGPVKESNASTTRGGVGTVSLADKICVLKATARHLVGKH